MPKSVGPVIYYVKVNGVQFPDLQLIMDAELRETFGRHDLFFLRIEYPRTYPKIYNLKTWADGTPVQITWGRSPDINTWYGYVNHSEISSNADSGSNTQQVTYALIGTSSNLNNDATMVWKNVSPTYIARQIARKHRLRCVVTRTTWLLDYEVQAGESDFSFMKRVADKTGMRFWCSGGTLYLLDPTVALYGTARLAVPSFSYNKQLAAQDTVRYFKMLQGKNLPGAVVASRSISGIDQTTGEVITAINVPAGDGAINYVNTERHVSSYAEAKQIVDSWQNLSQYWVGAKAQLFGNTLVYPGKLVQLNGIALPDGMAGYWLVTSAHHLLKVSGLAYPVLDRYLVDVEIMRNTKAANILLKGTQQVIPEFTTCAVNAGRWASNNLSTILTGIGA